MPKDEQSKKNSPKGQGPPPLNLKGIKSAVQIENAPITVVEYDKIVESDREQEESINKGEIKGSPKLEPTGSLASPIPILKNPLKFNNQSSPFVQSPHESDQV